MEYKWTVLTVTTVGVLMAGIDSMIVIVGLPQVAAALKADAEQAIWFTQAYTLGGTIVLLLIGRVTDIFGRVKIYIAGFAIFTVGSALISLSNNPTQVILFRTLQGFGSGILGINSATMIVDATPVQELGFSLGINMSAFRFGAIAGFTLSGLLLAIADWRALFYVNVPIGIFGTAWALKRLKEIGKVERKAPLDWIGFGTFTTFITAFLLSLTFAAYGIAERTTDYILIFIAAISITVFIMYERRQKHPLLDLRLLSIKEYTGGVIAQLLNSAAWGAVLLLLSLYLQLIMGLSPLAAGIRLVPFQLVCLAVGIFSGKLSDRYGSLPFTTGGLALASLSLYFFSTVDESTPYSTLLIYLIIFGVGVSIFASPNMSSIMGAVPPERRGVASAFRALMFNIGNSISLNLAILLLTLVVPFGLLTQIITAMNPVNITSTDRMLFMVGIQKTYLWLAVLNAAAIVPSILRGKRANGLSSTPKEIALES